MGSPFRTLPYDEFMIVAEEEWKIQCDKRDALAKFSTQIGNFEWHCSFKNHDTICLECQELIEGIVGEMRLEVIVYCRQADSLNYFPSMETPERPLLNADSKNWVYTIPSNYFQNILLTIRILKPRSQFPIFTAPNSVGHLASNGKLRIGQRIYHINKQLLGWFSPYFERMFNGGYVESKQEEVKLKEEEMGNPAIFEDFLLAICPPGKNEVLPNCQNVGDLLGLAKYYQVDSLQWKCERHLKKCREMGVDERILLAKKFELRELQAKIVNEVNSLEECKRICFALLNARE